MASETRPLRVLAVDDDRLQLRALERAVRDPRRIELTLVDNAIDALLAVGALIPDLVVMDIIMPGLDGLEACRRIKSNPATRDVQVVLASAVMTSALEREAKHAGARRAVQKPVDLAELLELTCDPLREHDATAARDPQAPVLMRGADALCHLLAEAGVEVVFGIPGGAISPVHDALLDSKIRTITTRHESGAMFAAAGYARATGKLGVVAVTSGPGALNAMTGLATAWCDGLPVLLLVGEVPRTGQGKGVLQDGSAHGLQIVEMTRHIAKLSAELPRTSALPHVVRRAITTALSGRPGPVVLTLPLDITTSTLALPRASGALAVDHQVAPETLDELAGLLRDAQRPLILTGNGARGRDTGPLLCAVAERFACPVATTAKGKGAFPENHPLALGVFGLGGHRSTQHYLEAGVDVVVAIGTSLGDLATDGFSPLLQAPRALVHIDIEAHQIGKSYAPTHAIVAGASHVLRGLLERTHGDAAPRPTLRALAGGVERQVLPSSMRFDRMAAHDAVRELQAVLPADTIYTIDSGEHYLFVAHYLETNLPDTFVAMTGLGSMGQSLGTAIGTQLAFPGRRVAAICGDGCFAMTAFEIATAVAERLPIRVFVFNDERLGMVENGHISLYGRTPAYPTTPLDVCTVARGLGATALRVERPGQIAAIADVLTRDPGPVVVEVCIDPEIKLARRVRVNAMPTSDHPRH